MLIIKWNFTVEAVAEALTIRRKAVPQWRTAPDGTKIRTVPMVPRIDPGMLHTLIVGQAGEGMGFPSRSTQRRLLECQIATLEHQLAQLKEEGE